MGGPYGRGSSPERQTWPGLSNKSSAEAHENAKLLSAQIHRATEADDVGALSSLVRQNSYWSVELGSARMSPSSFSRPSSLALNTLNGGGDTALFCACKRGQSDCARMLLASGASGDIRNKFRETAAHAAARGGFRRCLWLLLRAGANVLHMHDKLGELPFHAACYNNHRDCVKLLLAAGTHVDVATDAEGQTGSIICASLGHEDVLALLIANGANVNLAMRDGRTALHCAAAELNLPCMTLLLLYGANVMARDNRGRTAIMALKSNARGNVNDFNELLRAHGAC